MAVWLSRSRLPLNELFERALSGFENIRGLHVQSKALGTTSGRLRGAGFGEVRKGTWVLKGSRCRAVQETGPILGRYYLD